METFGNKLRELRIEKGLTQKNLADELQVSTPTLSHWECSYQEPSFKDLISISNYFKVSTDFLLCLEDDFGTPTPTFQSDVYTNDERELIKKYRELNAPGKKLIDTTINTLLSSSNSTLNKKLK